MLSGLRRTFTIQTRQVTTGLMPVKLSPIWTLGCMITTTFFRVMIRPPPSPGTECDRYYVYSFRNACFDICLAFFSISTGVTFHSPMHQKFIPFSLLLKVNEVFFQYSDGGRRKGLPMAPLSPCDVMSCHVELFTFSRQCSQHC